MRQALIEARHLRPDHLPVICGHVAEIITTAVMDGARYVHWIPAEVMNTDLDVEPRMHRFELDALVGVVRRADWANREPLDESAWERR